MPQPSAPQVDPLFAEIAKAIYGDDVDPRELLEKFSPGPSDLHIDGAVDPNKKARDEKRLAATGLAATGVAGVAGLHAVKATTVENKVRRAAAATGGDAGKATRAVGRVLRVKPTTAATAVGAGLLGLHGVELLGDSLAARAQMKAIKQAKRPDDDLSKGLRLRALNPMGVKQPSLRAKRPKANPLPGNPAAKGALYQPVNKGVIGGVRRTVRNVERTSAHAAYAADQMTAAARNATEATAKINDLIPGRRTVRRVAIGTGAGLGALTYTGARAGARSANKPPDDDDQVSKSVAERSVTWTGEISKVDTERRQVFGWASVSEIDGRPVVDLQGDIVPIEEIEKSAYRYVLESRKGGDMHRRVSKYAADTEPVHTADMIESFVVTPEKLSKMGLAPNALPHGWWIGLHVNDDHQWNLVKSGERRGFSIHGTGTRTPVDVSKSLPDTPALRRVRSANRSADRIMRATGTRSKVALRARKNAEVMEAAASKAGHSRDDVTHVMMDAWHDSERHAQGATTGPWIPHVDRTANYRAVEKSLSDVKDKARKTLRRTGESLKERTGQALHPPQVKLRPVKSSMAGRMGYQPQTRRLVYEMGKDPRRTYTYRVNPSVGAAAVGAESKGRYYNQAVKNKAKRSDTVTPAGRVRLFLHPDVSKAMPMTAMKAPMPAPPSMPTTQAKKPTLKPVAPKPSTAAAAPAPKPVMQPPAALQPSPPGGKVKIP